jgi:hypothetical protein
MINKSFEEQPFVKDRKNTPNVGVFFLLKNPALWQSEHLLIGLETLQSLGNAPSG